MAGITRKCIIDIAKAKGIRVFEEPVSIDTVSEYLEAFISSTIIGIIHVRSIEGMIFGDGRCGEITERIREAFIEKVDRDFVGRTLRYLKYLNSSEY